MSDPDRFRIIVVGGGVAGLTLANALEQAGVDYVLLERRDEVAPQVGASIGMFPSAARIYDQLGVWDKIDEKAERLRLFFTRDSKGGLICPADKSPLLMDSRFRYSIAWGERQSLLQCLYEHIRDPSKVLVNKDLADIKQDVDGVTAVCADGSSFRGDLLIGTDGVFSKTRSKMWEMAASILPDVVQADKDCLISEYNCLFGIAKGVFNPDLHAGDVHSSYNSGRCLLTIVAEAGKMYWFAQERLPKTHRLGDIPRYTDDDARDFVARHGDLVMLPAPHKLTLADIWQKTVSFRLVAIEEAKFKLWHWGRIACAGDSIHKATPNLGIGGNSAVESAVTLANGIKRLADAWTATGRRPSQKQVERMLTEYHAKREVRSAAVVDASGMLARLQNMHGPASRFFVHFALPQLSELYPELMSSAMIGGEKVDFLPLPMNSLTGTMPYNATQGDGLYESKLKRGLYALPILFLSAAATFVMDVEHAVPWAEALRESGSFDVGGSSVPILRSFYGLRSFDDFVALINTFFFPAIYGTDPLARRQIISFLTDGGVLLAIWVFESTRRANLFTPMQLPNIFTLGGQLIGIGVMAPLYCFLHYVLSPIEKFAALDKRLTAFRWSAVALPAVLLTYLAPFYLTVLWPTSTSPATRQAFLYIWQLYPVWLAAALFLLSRPVRDTMASDKVYRPLKDLGIMRLYVGGLAALSAVVYWWAWFAPGYGGTHSLREIFVPGALPVSMPNLAEFTREFLKWDATFGFGAHLVWLAYLFGDLARAGMLREGWWTVVGAGLVSLVLVGPGATLGLGWLWREQILATRKHKDALTPETVGRLHGLASE